VSPLRWEARAVLIFLLEMSWRRCNSPRQQPVDAVHRMSVGNPGEDVPGVGCPWVAIAPELPPSSRQMAEPTRTPHGSQGPTLIPDLAPASQTYGPKSSDI